MLVRRRMEKITDRKISASKGYDPSKRVSSSSDETQNIVKKEVYDPSKRIG